MNRREAKRHACAIVETLIEAHISSGSDAWPNNQHTDDEKQLVVALEELGREMRRRKLGARRGRA